MLIEKITRPMIFDSSTALCIQKVNNKCIREDAKIRAESRHESER